jgi:hypothetical protein
LLFVLFRDHHRNVTARLTEHETIVSSKATSHGQQLPLVAAVLVTLDLRGDLFAYIHAAGEGVRTPRIVMVQRIRVIKVRILGAIR